MKKIKEKTKKEIWQALKFTLFSLSAGIIQIVSFTILNEFIIKDVNSEYGWSYFISLVLSVLWNFTFNRNFTFKDASNVSIAMLKVFGYYLVFTPISILWGIGLAKIGWNEYLILALTMIINFVTEFMFQKFVVFRKPKIENKEQINANADTNDNLNEKDGKEA